MSDGVKPGDVVVYEGDEFFAAPQRGISLCHTGRFKCEFIAPAPNYRCTETPCDGVIWVTKLNYITHRLGGQPSGQQTS